MSITNYLGIPAAIFAIGILSACGGGNGPSPETGAPPAEEPTTPSQEPTPPAQEPTADSAPAATAFPVSADVDFEDEIVAIGPAWKYQSPQSGDLATSSRYDAVTVRSGRWRDPNGRDGSASANEVLRFIRAFQAHEHQVSGPQANLVVVDFGEQKTLRIGGAATETERDMVAAALSNINAALPWERRILLGPDISAQIGTREIPSGEIHLHFTSGKDEWPEDDDGYAPGVIGIGGVNYATSGGGSGAASILSGYVYVDRTLVRPTDTSMEFVLTHEILHAYGIGAHVDPDRYPDSILVPAFDQRRHPDEVPRVYLTLEGEALLALTRVRPGTRVSDLSPSDFGSWSTTGFHLLGSTGFGEQGEQTVQFGAGYRNGLAKPWAYGPVPATRIQDNPDLSEGATYTGNLLGFSGAGRTVAGAAAIGLNFLRFDGRADFTELESWASGSHPGAPGSGELWGDGDLGYTVKVEQDGSNASFSSAFASGDDPGAVTGALVGAAHEGAAGVLEHPDLSAAFGAVR